MLLTLLIFIILLGFLVFVHELGHFLTAKFHGIKTDEFGFGFPPRLIGFVKNHESPGYRIVWGSREVESPHTVYSLNWIPLGGFVRIKGEDGQEAADPNSFSAKPAHVRIQVLAAGVLMNFLLAWVLLSAVFMVGIQQPVDKSKGQFSGESKIQIIEVVPGTPAETMGLQPGDEIIAVNGEKAASLAFVSQMIQSHLGERITLDVRRLGRALTIEGIPRREAPTDQGALGIAFSETAQVSYPWHEAIWRGLQATGSITAAIFAALGKMIAGIFGGEKASLDVTGPIGIVYLTKQVSQLGFSYLLQFAALLSINLGIINILPIPALDGGRILFILIEKIKGSPVSKRTEGAIHQVGFIVLLFLMLLVTLRDFSHFDILGKISRFF